MQEHMGDRGVHTARMLPGLLNSKLPNTKLSEQARGAGFKLPSRWIDSTMSLHEALLSEAGVTAKTPAESGPGQNRSRFRQAKKPTTKHGLLPRPCHWTGS